MSTRRQQRVAEQIKIELSQLIEREIDDPRLNLINLTEVTISPDLHDATIYVSALAGESVKTEVLAGLEHARNFLRRRLGQEMKLRIGPPTRSWPRCGPVAGMSAWMQARAA